MLKINRCLVLPTSLEADAIYIVKDPKTTEIAALYITGKTKDVIFHSLLSSDVSTIAEELIDANGHGVITVDVLPDPKEHAGQLYALSGRNIPCWSNGTEWVNLLEVTGNTGSGSVDSATLRRLRDKLDFGISLPSPFLFHFT